MATDPYAVLGLLPDATPEQISRAWQEAALATHPDRGGSAERFRLARWAYDRLTNPAKVSPEPPADIRPTRGSDRRGSLTVSAEVALAGGVVLDRIGRQVRIPEDTGVADEILLVGFGGPGVPPGDLILTIDVAVAPPWRRDDLDLLVELPVTWLELYRGKAVQLRLPGGGEATVPVGPCTEPGQEVRLEGLGLRRGDERGDLRVSLRPQAPDPGDATLASVLLRLQLGAGELLRSDVLSALKNQPNR